MLRKIYEYFIRSNENININLLVNLIKYTFYNDKYNVLNKFRN